MPSPDGENLAVRVELVCAGEKEDDPDDIAEWGAFGFIFVLATLSFIDARPRGLSEVDYVKDDELNTYHLSVSHDHREGRQRLIDLEAPTQ